MKKPVTGATKLQLLEDLIESRGKQLDGAQLHSIKRLTDGALLIYIMSEDLESLNTSMNWEGESIYDAYDFLEYNSYLIDL